MPTRDGDPTKSSPQPPAGAAAAAPTGPVPREVQIKEMNASAKVRVKVPADWITEPVSVVLRNELKEAVAGVQFSVVCNANCGDDDVARFPKIIDTSFESQARPNRNTGDPARDAVRLNIEVLEEGDIPDGKLRVARITKPAGLKGPYREEIYAVCVRAKRGAKAVAAQAWAPSAREKELGSLIISACKTFEIL